MISIVYISCLNYIMVFDISNVVIIISKLIKQNVVIETQSGADPRGVEGKPQDI